MAKKPVRILVQCVAPLSNVLLSLPAISELAREFPYAKIDVLSTPEAAPILYRIPNINNVYQLPQQQVFIELRNLGLFKTLKKHRYSVFISYWEKPHLGALGFCLGIPVRIGAKRQWWTRFLYTHLQPIRVNDFTRHKLFLNMDLLIPLKIQNYQLRNLSLAPGDQLPRGGLLEGLPADKKVVLVNHSRGLIEHRVIDRIITTLTGAHGTDFFTVIHNPKLKKGQINFGHNRVEFSGHGFSVAHWMELLSRSSLLVTPNCWQAHYAAMIDLPILLVSSSLKRYPTRWGPYSKYLSIFRFDNIKSAELPGMIAKVEEKLNEWLDLLADPQQEIKKLSGSQLRRNLYLSSFRVLAVFRSKKEYLAKKASIARYQSNKLMIYPLYCLRPSILSILPFLRLLRIRNINIIQGERLPLGLAFVAKVWCWSKGRWPNPVRVNCPIHSGIGIDDLLTIYEMAWQQHIEAEYEEG